MQEKYVSEVLLVDGWHRVIEGSFRLRPFGDRQGFWFQELGSQDAECLSGPLSSVLAVREVLD